MKLFLVDDDVVFLKSLEIEFLHHTCFSIETYTTGKSCIENLSQNPDVIILDYQLDGIDMSAMSGIETLDKIKNLNSEIPVVILSSQDKIDLAVKCMHMGAFDYVVKSETTFLHLQKIIAANSRYKKMEETEKWADKLIIANKELAFQYEENEKRASELVIANKELLFQNEEKEKRASELILANKELAFQYEEKGKRASELIIANNELLFQNEEKGKRASELIIANNELLYQNEEKEKRANELIIAKEKAEESEKLKTAFLENISHEIRTPLNGIIGFSMLLNDDDIDKSDIKKYTNIINQSGKRLIDLVENVLDISKIQTGQLTGNKNLIEINTVFSDLVTFFSPVTNVKNINLKYHKTNGKNITIYSDEGKLIQILTNLINNAIKFTTSGNIDIGYEIGDTTVKFYVSDTGIGIPEELFDKIFDRFTQVDLTHKRGYDGAGLGLAICKGLVQLLGGRIWVESEINKGSIFFFTLPYTPDIQPAKPETRYSNIPGDELNIHPWSSGMIEYD